MEFNTLTGEISEYPSLKRGEKIGIGFNLHPAGSLLLFISNKLVKVEKKQALMLVKHELKSSEGLKIDRVSSNTLTLDYCDLFLDQHKEKGLYYYTAANKIWQHHGFKEDNPWVNATQYKTDVIDRDTFGLKSGFDAEYHFLVKPGVDKTTLSAVIERPSLWKVEINGEVVDARENEWWLDRQFGVFDIGDKVQDGQNSIRLITHPMSVYAELEPVYILGGFSLESAVHGWTIIPEKTLTIGQWTEQGLPFYKDGISYTKSVDLKKDSKGILVKLNEWRGTVATVLINGKDVGIIGWPPYELEITNNIVEGKNEISVIVYGSLKNLLGPHHNVRDRGIVTPWSFKYAPEKQPAGLDYDLDGYGLLDEFQVFEMK